MLSLSGRVKADQCRTFIQAMQQEEEWFGIIGPRLTTHRSIDKDDSAKLMVMK